MKMIIGGNRVDSRDGATIDVFNPMTLEVIDTVPSATKEDVNEAIICAQKGFEEWSAVPLYKRGAVLKRFAALMAEHQEELAKLLTQEVGKPINSARGEVGASVSKTEVYVEAANHLGGESYSVNNCAYVEDSLIATVREPLGIVVAVIPFNFPVNILVNKVIPALIMGNSVIIKAASVTPLASIRFTELILEAGVPANAVQILTGSGSSIGSWLVDDPRIAAVTLTGSTRVGVEISKAAAPHLHHVMLELGGNDATIVMPDADLDYAVSDCVANRSANSGQVCCCPKRFIVHNSIKPLFLEKLIAALKQKKVGDPMLETTDCGPLVSVNAAKQVEKQVAHTVEQGGKVLLGGHRYDESFFELTVIDTPKTADSARSMEIFGPVWTVIGYDDREEALAIANDSDYGLDAGVIGKDMKEMLWFLKRLQAGTCVAGACGRFCPPYSPFGGYKKSGLGREGAFHSLEEMSQIKSLVLKRCYQ